MGFTLGQVPEQPAVYRTERQLACLCPLPGTFNVIQQPGNLGSREVRVYQQSGAVHHQRFVAVSPQLGAQRSCAPVLPDNGVVDRLRSEEHTSELQSRPHLVCRLLLEKKKTQKK